MKVAQLSRRGFLIGAAGAGVHPGFRPNRDCQITAPAGGRQAGLRTQSVFQIDRDGRVTVNIAEPKWGSMWAPPWRGSSRTSSRRSGTKVDLTMSTPIPSGALMVTGGSWSVWQNFKPLSQAGAAGRQALIEEGAKLLGVTAASCTARNSHVIAGASRSVMPISSNGAS